MRAECDSVCAVTSTPLRLTEELIVSGAAFTAAESARCCPKQTDADANRIAKIIDLHLITLSIRLFNELILQIYGIILSTIFFFYFFLRKFLVYMFIPYHSAHLKVFIIKLTNDFSVIF